MQLDMISFERVQRFLQKPPEQRRTTARFFATTWLARLPYAPHKVRLTVNPQEQVKFWWSYFPPSFQPDRGAFEYWGDDIGEIRLLWNFLQPGMTFLDIGAYHGIYSVIAAKKMGSAGRVVAFEPSPRERRRMQLHLRYNGTASVALEPYALAAGEGKAALAVVVDGGFTTMNSLRTPPVDHATSQVTVDTIALDTYLERKHIEKVDLVKIDTEGGEVEAFRGADKLLASYRPLVICEVVDLVTKVWGYAAKEIMNTLRTYNYEWFDVLPDGSTAPHQPREEYPVVKNYLAVPREKKVPL